MMIFNIFTKIPIEKLHIFLKNVVKITIVDRNFLSKIPKENRLLFLEIIAKNTVVDILFCWRKSLIYKGFNLHEFWFFGCKVEKRC